MEDKEYLGKGWGFPPHFNIISGTVDMVSEEEDIRQSLQILLSTKPGERYLVPSFGCDVSDFQFKGMTNALRLKLKGLISDAITRHEHRITLIDVFLDSSKYLEGTVMVDIQYMINSTNSRSNLVYPFHIEQ